MSGWNGSEDGGGDGDGAGFGYDAEPEPAPEPEPARAYRSARTARPSAARSTPQPQPRQTTTLGAEEEMGYIASLVDRYVTTPAFLAAQVDKIANDPEAEDIIGQKLRPYVIFAVAGGLVFGFVGAWVYRKWTGFRSNGGIVKGIARKLLA